MSIITKETFVSATFIDQDRKNLEVLLNMGHTDELHLTPHIVEADEDNADYQELLKITHVRCNPRRDTWKLERGRKRGFYGNCQAKLMYATVKD